MKKLCILLILGLAIETNAQQRPVNSLYMFDPVLINPALAGAQVQNSVTSIYRNQWVNFPGAPKTFTVSAHSGFNKARIGLGFLASSDQIGIHNENSLYFLYSYKLRLSRYNTNTSLTFGLQGGFNNLKSDFSLLNPKDVNDPFSSLAQRSMTWNFGTGLFYRHKKMYIGLSIPYILNNKVISSRTFSSYAQRSRYYYLTSGFTKQVSKNVKLIPSTLIRIQEQAPLSIDFNLTTVLYNVVGLGISYRLNDSVIGLFELQINENFHVGYAYDYTLSEIARYSNGTHEIMLNYRIKIAKLHQGLPCPSYW